MMKRLLLAASVLALTSGGAFAQNDQSPAQSPTMPPAATPGGGGSSSGAGTMGQAPKTRTMHHAATHASPTRVKQAQQALKQEGLYKGKVDGKYGPNTKAAVAAFQKQNGLKQSAQLDRATMNKLEQGGGSSGGGMPSGGGGMPSGGGGGAPSGGGMPSGGGSQYH